MNRLAIWVARTAVGATVPMALAQAMASPLPQIAASSRLAPDIIEPPLVAMKVSFGLEGMARAAKIQHAKIQHIKSASPFSASTVHRVTANDSRFHDTNGSVLVPPRAWHR
jgi:hypothetical protein